jgi:BASS family bile acid:Na+ symporter
LIKPVLDGIANVSLVPLVALIVVLNIDKVLNIFGTHDILAAALLAVLGLGVGWLLGGPDTDTRRALALCTGLRNFAIALVVASQSFDDPRVETMVMVAAVIGLMITLPLSWMSGR